MPTIVVTELAKHFKVNSEVGVIRVIDSVSLTLDGTGVAAILGPNGVGKSTMLKMLSGAIQPSRGQILINGAELAKEKVRYVDQRCPVLPWRRVIDDICLGLEIAGYGRSERHAYAMELLDEIGFTLPMQQRSYTLSGGQRQLVNICRALVGPKRPELILMDEPGAHLDLPSRIQLLGYLDVVLNVCNARVLLTAHDLEWAVLASDVIVPFRSMPVAIADSDIIEVALPRPRTQAMLRTPDFHMVHRLVTERLFA